MTNIANGIERKYCLNYVQIFFSSAFVETMQKNKETGQNVKKVKSDNDKITSVFWITV